MRIKFLLFDILFFDNGSFWTHVLKCRTTCIKHNDAICKGNECEEILQHALETYLGTLRFDDALTQCCHSKVKFPTLKFTYILGVMFPRKCTLVYTLILMNFLEYILFLKSVNILLWPIFGRSGYVIVQLLNRLLNSFFTKVIL